MKNIFTLIQVAVFVLATVSCSKEKYDLLPGEVQLKSTDFKNNDNMSYEAVTVWHAVIISAQKDFEFQNFDYEDIDGTTRKVYNSPTEAEEAFDRCVEKSFVNVQSKYSPDLISEIIAARPEVISEYVWCSALDEYTTLKFVVEPTLPE